MCITTNQYTRQNTHENTHQNTHENTHQNTHTHTYTQLVEAGFGRAANTLYTRTLNVTIATPLQACTPLTNNNTVRGTAVLVQRGNCTFEDKARAVQNAGGVLMVVYDNQAGSYFVMAAQESTKNTVGVVFLCQCFVFFL